MSFEILNGRMNSTDKLLYGKRGPRFARFSKKRKQPLLSWKKTLRALQGEKARTSNECKEGAPEPLPARPIDAVPVAEREEFSALVCAGVWEEAISTPAEDLYEAIKKRGTWDDRHKADTHLQKLNHGISISPSEKKAFVLAAEQGKRFMHYDAAVSKFQHLTSRCQSDVMNKFAEKTRQWEQDEANIKAAPRLQLEKCKKDTAIFQEAKHKLTNLKLQVQEAQAEVDRLLAARPHESHAESLDSFTCD